MTRFARGGTANKKKPLEASSWTEMKQADRTEERKDKTESQKPPGEKRDETASKKSKDPLRKIKHQKDFKHKGKGKHGKSQSFPEEGEASRKHIQKPTPAGIATKLAEVKSQMPGMTKVEEAELTEYFRKDARREDRRVMRVQERHDGMVCFNCRLPGHRVADCPEMKKDTSQGTGICFKCGSTEHTVHNCRVKVPPGVYPYAKCFICGEQGHLSSKCPDNPRGLYPKGGCCNECGSVEHFRKDCPDMQRQQGIEDVKLPRVDRRVPNNKHKKVPHQSVDAEVPMKEKDPIQPKKKVPKVVKF